MNKYRQQATLVLTQEQVISLGVALNEYLRYTQEALSRSPTYSEADKTPHPDSCMGRAKEIADEMMQVRLGNKNLKFTTWEMVRVSEGAK